MLFDKLFGALKSSKNDDADLDVMDDDDIDTVRPMDINKKNASYSDNHFVWVISNAANKSKNDYILDVCPYTCEFQRIFLMDSEKKLQKKIADIYLNKLKNCTVSELISFSYECRGGWYETDFMFWNEKFRAASFSRQKFLHLNSEQYAAMLWVGCFDSNGYCRENCLNELNNSMAVFYSDKYKTKLSCLIPFVLRMIDNVEVTSKKAFSMSVSAIKKADKKEFSIYLPVLEHLMRSTKANNVNCKYISDMFAEKMKAEFAGCEAAEIAGIIMENGSSLLSFTVKNPIFSFEQMSELMKFFNDANYKLKIFNGMISFYGDRLSPDEYLNDKCRSIRYSAANLKYEREGLPWDGLYDTLLDKSASLRELAVYVLNKHYGLNAHDYYCDKLAEVKNSGDNSHIAVCLTGISEHGGKDDLPVIEEYLDAENPQIIKAAVTAYGRIMGENGKDVYWEHITGGNISGMVTAFRMAKKYHVRYPEKALYDLYLANIGTKRSEIAVKLLLDNGTWEMICYILEICDDKNLPLSLRQLITASLGRRYSYRENVSYDETERINEVLERKKEFLPWEVYHYLSLELRHILKK